MVAEEAHARLRLHEQLVEPGGLADEALATSVAIEAHARGRVVREDDVEVDARAQRRELVAEPLEHGLHPLHARPCLRVGDGGGAERAEVAAHEVRRRVGVEMISVYVPTTPNPTSGFFLMMPRAETIELNMSVDEALKYVVSMGVVAPADRDGAVVVAMHRE